ncbi:hypothetical protein CVT26_002596 [Gymnopilus dilepis]|uniref:Aminoglycoside phosphotransferase domain-containing protein n=1 Tax=Gymnopilus dilepis TaxID=231916 RepID=A0A409VF45_9AGAR|nr:hypothetical protein CVT26_002596 [Gymnopilus dilepis]
MKATLSKYSLDLVKAQATDGSRCSDYASDTPSYLIPPVRELQNFELLEFRFNLFFRRKKLRGIYVLRNGLFPKTGTLVRLQEALSMQFISRNTAIAVPRVFDVFSINGKVHILQEFIAGHVLEDVWHTLSSEQQRNCVVQLKEFLDQMRALKPPHPECVQAIDGSGLIDTRISPDVWGPFDSHADFHRFLNYDFIREHPEQYPRVQESLAKVSGKCYTTVFSHGDLGPHNIILKADGKIAIIDWEMSGWFPEYWEYTRAYAARGHIESWWAMFRDTVARYDDELELMTRIEEYFESV